MIITKKNSIKISKKIPTKLLKKAGVYLFLDSNLKPIYIGKSINIKFRVTSYFSKAVFGKTKKMVEESRYFHVIYIPSDFEALILEAQLIKKYQPKYNYSLKDDKSPLYIVITKDKYPLVLSVRKNKIPVKYQLLLGPFPSSKNVRDVLLMLRRIFPYSTHKISKRKCLYSHMKLCDPCPNEIESQSNTKLKMVLTQKYQKNIFIIKGILTGRFNFVLKSLEKEMIKLSKKENFEDANDIKKQIEALNYITAPKVKISDYLVNPNIEKEISNKQILDLKILLNKYFKIKSLIRIECFDVSHLSGIQTTASMVTFIEGQENKSLYRRFKIKTNKKGDDLAAMKEVIKRRLKHLNNWGKPDLIIVDGGKTQVKVFYKELKNRNIPVIGITKSDEKLMIPYISNNLIKYKKVSLNGPAKILVQRIRNEAHRFAKSYHQWLLKNKFITE